VKAKKKLYYEGKEVKAEKKESKEKKKA